MGAVAGGSPATQLLADQWTWVVSVHPVGGRGAVELSVSSNIDKESLVKGSKLHWDGQIMYEERRVNP